jgi:transposase InsO family protein
MPWRKTCPMEERIRFVVLALQSLRSFSALCDEFGISRQTGYKWLTRYRESGSLQGLSEVSRRPHHSPQRVAPNVEGRVISLRQRYGWGARKLRVLLQEDGVELGTSTVNRILSRNGLVADEDRHRPASKRFCREAPNELWQMDIKGPFPIREGCCYPLSILDDHSRFLLGLYSLLNTRGDTVYQHLLRTFGLYGLPDAMLMDHGSPWWSTTNSLGLTWLSVSLIKQDIALYFSGVRHPQTQGKVERLHGSLARALKHAGTPLDLEGSAGFFVTFRDDYNERRPHESLDMAVPASRYRPSQRAFDPHPRAWHYPDGVRVLRLNSQGMLTYGATRYFACEALADDLVGVQEFDGKLLVSYRHMPIREIDLRTKHTLPLVRPIQSAVSTMS